MLDPEFVDYLRDGGLVVVLLVFIIIIFWAVRRLSSFLADKLFGDEGYVPKVVKSHTEFLTTVSTAIKTMQAIQKEHSEDLNELKHAYTHPDSPLSTVKTNQALWYLAQLVDAAADSFEDDARRNELKRHASDMSAILSGVPVSIREKIRKELNDEEESDR